MARLTLLSNALFAFSLCLANTLQAAELGTPDRDDIEYPAEEPPPAAEIDLGKTLFFDERLSANQSQSCATCHNPDLGFGDGFALSINDSGAYVKRNTPHLYNLAWSSILLWDGRADNLDKQALAPIASPTVMNLPHDKMIERLSKVDYYVKTFKNVYDDGLTVENVGKAIGAFERSLISDSSPFDQYLAGQKTAMSPDAIRGLELFKGKANCIACHDGPNFTDDSFHNLGIGDEDLGRGVIAKDATLNNSHKTPGLRNVALTAPYMHNGSVKTLQDVVEFYNKGGENKAQASIKPLNLTPAEVRDLVAFLGALTDPVDITRPDVPK